jgi:hypothetical protein
LGDDESTPTEMAKHDLHEMKREIDEANMNLGVASALNATADVMNSLGFDEAATAASAGAARANAAAMTDVTQAMTWQTAASEWQDVAHDLRDQSSAQGAAWTAGVHAAHAEDQLAGGGLSEAAKTTAEVEAARGRAEEQAYNKRAEELGDAARESADDALALERAAMRLEDQ